MIVGAALIELHVHGSQSLKQKRGVVRSITQRVRNRFNLSVAEVGGQGTWQRVELALTAAGSDERVVRRALEKALHFVENLHLAEVTGSEIAILELPQEPGLEQDIDLEPLEQVFGREPEQEQESERDEVREEAPLQEAQEQARADRGLGTLGRGKELE